MKKLKSQQTRGIKSKRHSNRLARRLTSYSLAAAAAMAMGNRSDAEMTYSNPTDVALDSAGYTDVDIDGEASSIKFKFKVGTNGIYIRAPYYEAGFINSAASLGAAINAGEGGWRSNIDSDLYYTGLADRVMGIWRVRFDCTGGSCYGWIRYQGIGTDDAVITDWAYEAANVTARAGATASSWALHTGTSWALYTGDNYAASPPGSINTDATISTDGAGVIVSSDLTMKNLMLLSGYLGFSGSNTVTIHGDVYNSSLTKRLSTTDEPSTGGSIVLHSSISVDSTPIPGGAGALAINGTTLSWNKATDSDTNQGSLQYRVYKSAANTLVSITGVEAASQVTADWMTDIDSLADLDTPGSYYNVIVKDEAGNKAIYVQVQYPAGDVQTP